MRTTRVTQPVRTTAVRGAPYGRGPDGRVRRWAQWARPGAGSRPAGPAEPSS